MKKKVLSFALLVCMLVSICSYVTIDAYAVNESAGIRNRLDEILTYMNSKLPTKNIFTSDGKQYSGSPSRTECSLYGILPVLGEDAKAWEKLSSNGYNCAAFAKYILVKTFGTAKDTKDTANIGQGNKESTYSTFRTGDLFYTTKANGEFIHWMIFISSNSNGITVLESNGQGSSNPQHIRYNTYAYSAANLAGSVTVWQSPHWDSVNKQYSAQTYTVTYNANGGINAPAQQTKTENVNLQLSTTIPTRSGYTFLGWATSSTATTAAYAAGAAYTGNANLSLYAVWKAVDEQKAGTYKITGSATNLYSGPASTNSVVVQIPAGTRIIISEVSSGWGKAMYGYSNGWVSMASVEYVSADTKSYEVGFNANGGVFIVDGKEHTGFVTSVVNGNPYGNMGVPTSAGYVFKGWYTAINGGELITSTTIINLTANQTLYARWEPEAVQPPSDGSSLLSSYLITSESDPNVCVGVRLEWTPVSGIVYYRVFRASYSDGYSYPLTDFAIKGTSYVDVKIQPDKEYYYIVRPLISEGNAWEDIDEELGPYSNEISCITTPEILEPDEEPGAEKCYILMQLDNPMMDVNGIKAEVDPGRGTSPFLRHGRTMLPIRAVTEAMCGTVAWDSSERKTSLEANGNSVEMWIDNMDYTVNGEGSSMDIAPFIENDRTMLPLRFVTENLNCKVTWMNETKEILIVFYGQVSTGGQ